jgi:hypothetical protein
MQFSRKQLPDKLITYPNSSSEAVKDRLETVRATYPALTSSCLGWITVSAIVLICNVNALREGRSQGYSSIKGCSE